MENFKAISNIKNHQLLDDSYKIIDDAQQEAYHAVNISLIKRNWLLGLRINEEVLKEQRAEYGEKIIDNLARKLTERYGPSYTKRNLHYYIRFYRAYCTAFEINGISSAREIVHAMRAQFGKQSNIVHAMRALYPIHLSWTHYRILLQESNKEAREWYEKEAFSETWSSRILQRNISSQYYYRLLQSQHKDLVKEEMIAKTSPLQNKLEFIKNPIIAEFLGLPADPSFTESELESSIISNLQKFIMELGKGYAFVARQQHIHTEKEDYYIDLVFYNYIIKAFVLIDLKTNKVTHQDVGQMDMYVRMYDEQKRTESDNPTIGILLCADTDEDIARYSILHDNNQLFATKYKTYLPTPEELRAEIESQKHLYYLQHENKE